jgi:hypothetical protein
VNRVSGPQVSFSKTEGLFNNFARVERVSRILCRPIQDQRVGLKPGSHEPVSNYHPWIRIQRFQIIRPTRPPDHDPTAEVDSAKRYARFLISTAHSMIDGAELLTAPVSALRRRRPAPAVDHRRRTADTPQWCPDSIPGEPTQCRGRNKLRCVTHTVNRTRSRSHHGEARIRGGGGSAARNSPALCPDFLQGCR